MGRDPRGDGRPGRGLRGESCGASDLPSAGKRLDRRSGPARRRQRRRRARADPAGCVARRRCLGGIVAVLRRAGPGRPRPDSLPRSEAAQRPADLRGLRLEGHFPPGRLQAEHQRRRQGIRTDLGRWHGPRQRSGRGLGGEPVGISLGPRAREPAARSDDRILRGPASRRGLATWRAVGRPHGLERQLPGAGAAGHEPGGHCQHSERTGPALCRGGGATQAPKAHRADQDPERPAGDRAAQSRLVRNRAATVPNADDHAADEQNVGERRYSGGPGPVARRVFRYGRRS